MKALILGGVKSGKSRYAERLAQGFSGSPCLVATACAHDDEMSARIERHRKDRSPDWTVLEEPVNLGALLQTLYEEEVVVIDCLTLWMTNLLMEHDEGVLRAEIESLKESVASYTGNLVIVSNETNMGITPLGEISRRYCDEMGLLHQHLADMCSNVELIVAGIPMKLKGE